MHTFLDAPHPFSSSAHPATPTHPSSPFTPPRDLASHRINSAPSPSICRLTAVFAGQGRRLRLISPLLDEHTTDDLPRWPPSMAALLLVSRRSTESEPWTSTGRGRRRAVSPGTASFACRLCGPSRLLCSRSIPIQSGKTQPSRLLQMRSDRETDIQLVLSSKRSDDAWLLLLTCPPATYAARW
jgi:hypothetical protein